MYSGVFPKSYLITLNGSHAPNFRLITICLYGSTVIQNSVKIPKKDIFVPRKQKTMSQSILNLTAKSLEFMSTLPELMAVKSLTDSWTIVFWSHCFKWNSRVVDKDSGIDALPFANHFSQSVVIRYWFDINNFRDFSSRPRDWLHLYIRMTSIWKIMCSYSWPRPNWPKIWYETQN